MSEWVPIVVALIALLSAVGVPVITTRMNWARQDAVAARLEASNRKVAETAKAAAEETRGKLEVIHTLVDGGMTKALQVALDSTILWLGELKRHPEGQRELIEETERRIAEMRKDLEYRQGQAAIVADQQHN